MLVCCCDLAGWALTGPRSCRTSMLASACTMMNTWILKQMILTRTRKSSCRPRRRSSLLRSTHLKQATAGCLANPALAQMQVKEVSLPADQAEGDGSR
jgi:hypothetical protein